MPNLTKFSVWILLVIIQTISRAISEVTIFPDNLTVLESSKGKVRCTYKGNINIQGASFTFNGSEVAIIFLPRCKFNTLGLDRYRTDCEGNKTFTLTLINISRHDHGKHVRCIIFLNNASPESSLNRALIDVNVPVKNVSITSPAIEDGVLSVCEHVNASLQCTTSATRPAANISWIYQSKFSTGDITIVPSNGNTIYREENDLFITASTLYIIANRSLNSWYIFCSSSNYPDIVVNSSSITTDVLYPPELLPKILNLNVTNGDTYRIIAGRQGILTCAVPISNPNATLTWIGLEHSINIANNIDFVSNTLEWVASRHDKNLSTCIIKHECNNLTKSISLTIDVLYPPTIKPMKDVSIVEGSMLNITCDITLGVPEAVTIKWTRQSNILLTNSRLLTIQNISRASTSIYTCHVENIMKPTIGIEERGESSSSIYINVLYPPKVDPINNQTVIEGSDFNLSCAINPGIPNTTNITWTSVDGRIRRATQFLSFKNISRIHTAIYACTAFNIMNPTNNIKVKGYDSERFHLIVEYGATIKSFFIIGYNSYRNVTLSEHDNVTFHCNVDSLPTSTTDIKFQNGRRLKSTNSTNNVSYNMGPATCLDSGIYECLGRNKHNSMQKIAEKQLILLVNCFPRPHPKTQVKSKIFTALNVPLVLRFTAVAYPLPTTVNWQKYNGFNWTIIMSYNDTSIRNSNLVFNLTFSNVQHEDLGQFKLAIFNDIGKFEQHFTIIPADRPKPPTKFRVITEEISISSITVGWFPSFNGGQPQHFVLHISKSDEQLWTSETVQDNRDTYMNYTFEGLLSGTSYKLFIYAENILGHSNFSDTLLVKTKDKDVSKENKGGRTMGIIICVVLGIIGAIVAVFLVICFFRKRLLCKRQSDSKDVIYQNELDVTPDKSCNTNENEHIPMHNQKILRKQTGTYLQDTDDIHDTNIHYESLDNNKRDTNEYSQLSRHYGQVSNVTENNDRHAGSEEYVTNTHVPIYTNLKL